MKIKILLFLTILLYLQGCTKSSKNDFYIMQEGVVLKGEILTLKRKAFSILAKEKGYFSVFSKEPISFLKNKRKILKLIGTTAAWTPNKLNAILYEPSTILAHKDMCEVYDEATCKEYRSKTDRLGFIGEPTYTFGAYFVEKNYQKFNKIDAVPIEDVPSGVYYIYLFKNIGRIDTISDIQEVTTFKIKVQ